MKQRSISEKQYCIILSFALMMIFTTGSVLLFLTSFVEVLLFLAIMIPVSKNVENTTIRRAVFMLTPALIGEVIWLLNDMFSLNIPMVGFWLLPGATVLFLLAPLARVNSRNHDLTFEDIFHGVTYYFVNGGLIALLREALSFDTFCGIKLDVFDKIRMPLFGHASGGALLVILSLLLLRALRVSDTGTNYVLNTSTGMQKKYRPISKTTEKDFVMLNIGMLIYDVIFAGVGVIIILQVPSSLRRQSHIVTYSTILSLLLLFVVFTIIKRKDVFEKHTYLPLLTVIRSSLPMIFYTNHLTASIGNQAESQIIWWIVLILAVWLCSTIALFYIHVISGRLLFGKQPDFMEGIPFVLLHCLLALIVFMPWMDVLTNL